MISVPRNLPGPSRATSLSFLGVTALEELPSGVERDGSGSSAMDSDTMTLGKEVTTVPLVIKAVLADGGRVSA